MLWVGGGIVIHGVHELGWHAPEDIVHAAEETLRQVTGALGGILGWFTRAALSALVGLTLGGAIAFLLHKVFRLGKPAH